MRYPVKIERDDNGTYLVTFPDVPGAVTYGDTREQASQRAPDAVLTVFDALMKDRRDIPEPSPTNDRPSIELPALEVIKIGIYRAMRDAHVSKSELARRLDWHLPQVDRVLQMRHASRLDQVESALGVLGRQLEVRVVTGPVVTKEGSLRTKEAATRVHRQSPKARQLFRSARRTGASAQKRSSATTVSRKPLRRDRTKSKT